MKKYEIRFLYTCGGNWKTGFSQIVETKDDLKLGEEITMGEYGTPTQDEFFESDYHEYKYDSKYDHNILTIDELKVLNLIKTNYGNFYFRNVMIDVDGTTLEEGCNIWDEDMNLVSEVVGLDINDEILDKDNLPESYTNEDYDMQVKRVENAINGIL